MVNDIYDNGMPDECSGYGSGQVDNMMERTFGPGGLEVLNKVASNIPLMVDLLGRVGDLPALIATLTALQAAGSLGGSPGKSAYQLALDNGYTGTLSQWLASLHGQDGLNGNNAVGTPGAKGDPGGNVLAVGLFTDIAAMNIPNGTDIIRTSGWSQPGVGSALYVADAAVNGAYVTAHPTTSKISLNNRGFRLITDQKLDVAMFGDLSTSAASADALTAAFDYQPFQASQGLYFGPEIKMPYGEIKSTRTLEPNGKFNMIGHASGYYDGVGAALGSTTLTVPLNTVAIRLRGNATDGPSTINVAGKNSAGGSRIENMVIRQEVDPANGYQPGNDRTAHGIAARSTLDGRNLCIHNTAGDAIHIVAAFDGDATTRGNANNWFLSNIEIHDCASNGLVVGGADSNAGVAIAFYCHKADRACIIDYAYYANTYIAPQFNHSGQTGCFYQGYTYQLLVMSDMGTVPGTNRNVWYKRGAAANADGNFPIWDANTTYYFTGPALINSPSVVITPYQENGYTFMHAPSSLIIGGNCGISPYTTKIYANGYGLVSTRGVGYYMRGAYDTSLPAYQAKGLTEFTMIGFPGFSNVEAEGRAYIMAHRVGEDLPNGHDWSIRYEGSYDGNNVPHDIASRHGGDGGKVMWSFGTPGTTVALGRASATDNVALFRLHDVALWGPSLYDGRRIGIRDQSTTTGEAGQYHARGENYFQINPSPNNPVALRTVVTSGAPGVSKATAWGVYKGDSASRPGGLGTEDIGVMYMDTTLTAGGKPIWWNGAAWVDATGAIV